MTECTHGEIEIFNKMYHSIDDIKPDKIDWAIQQVLNTTEKRLDKELDKIFETCGDEEKCKK